MAAETLTLLKAGFDIAKAAKDVARRDNPDHRLNDEICQVLRAIYFAPNGILSLLKELARTGGVPAADLRERLLNFNDREWKVARALEAINFERLGKELRLSLATAQTLEQIRYGKISLRRSIQEEVNYYGRRGAKPDLDQVRAMIAGIEKLNSDILEVERLVNARAVER